MSKSRPEAMSTNDRVGEWLKMTEDDFVATIPFRNRRTSSKDDTECKQFLVDWSVMSLFLTIILRKTALMRPCVVDAHNYRNRPWVPSSGHFLPDNLFWVMWQTESNMMARPWMSYFSSSAVYPFYMSEGKLFYTPCPFSTITLIINQIQSYTLLHTYAVYLVFHSNLIPDTCTHIYLPTLDKIMDTDLKLNLNERHFIWISH